MRSLRLLGAALAAAVLLAVVAAAPASAHNRFVSSDPADGATVARTPAAVVLTFDEPALALGTQVVVMGPGGPAASGPAQLVDATVRQPLVGGAPAGAYTVEWKVTSDDGHPITGQLRFTSEAAGSGTPTTPAPAAPAEEGAPAWGWVLLAAALLAIAGVTAVLRRRQRARED